MVNLSSPAVNTACQIDHVETITLQIITGMGTTNTMMADYQPLTTTIQLRQIFCQFP